MTALDTIAEYGARIDARADSFLARGDEGLYGMLRYFMGYIDEKFVPVTESGGKRLRPGLLLYVAEQYGTLDAALPAALSIELFHNFTLIHDDIEDHDELRRGRPTVWKLWGVNKAINAGDAQVICSMQALRDKNVLEEETYRELEQFLLNQYLKVIEGQHLDFTLAELALHSNDVSVERYLEMARKKSAELVAASTKAAAVIAQRPVEEQECLYTFGLNLGIGWQLKDDRDSLWGEAGVTGKNFAGDILEHKKTYPILFARKNLSFEDSTRLEELYASTATSVEEVLDLLEKAGALDATRELIKHYVEEAKESLTKISLSNDSKKLLEEFVSTLL